MGRLMDHRGTNYEVEEVGPFKWRWTIYAKKSSRLGKVSREVTGTRREAIASCKLTLLRQGQRAYLPFHSGWPVTLAIPITLPWGTA